MMFFWAQDVLVSYDTKYVLQEGIFSFKLCGRKTSFISLFCKKQDKNSVGVSLGLFLY